MPNQDNKSPVKVSVTGESFNLLHIIFTLLAGLCVLFGLALLLYQLWGLLAGNGWNSVPLGAAFAYLLGPPLAGPYSGLMTVLTIAEALPLALVMLALAWVLNKIGNGFEKLS